jgi:hypothetical protein
MYPEMRVVRGRGLMKEKNRSRERGRLATHTGFTPLDKSE